MSAVQPNHILSDLDAIETREWMDALSVPRSFLSVSRTKGQLSRRTT